MTVWYNPVHEREAERRDEYEPSSDLITQRQALLCLQRGYTRSSDQYCKKYDADLGTHDAARNVVESC